MVIALFRGGYVGYKSGVIAEVLRIAGLIFAIVVTFYYYLSFARTITLYTVFSYLHSQVAAVLLIALAVLIAAKLISSIVLKIFKVTEGGGIISRSSGMVSGMARWVLLVSLFFLLFEFFPADSLRLDIHQRSYSGAEVAKIAPQLFDFLSTLVTQVQ